MSPRRPDRSQLIAVAWIVAATALAYLPNLVRATVYRDDWYYVLDRMIGGVGIFQAMFSIDRPARGPFFELYYQLFRFDPLPYHLASYVWRLLASLAALLLFSRLWPGHRRAAVWMAVLFALFPGYLHWMEGFEDQPAIASVCLETLSIALTLIAVDSTSWPRRIAAWACSILTGWAYLALVDYAIGMEIFRLLCVFVLVDRKAVDAGLLRRAVSAARAWVPAAAIPGGFLIWRLLFFHNVRPQTDVARQLGVLLASPIDTAADWLVRLVRSTFDVAAFAWVTPVLQGFFSLRLKQVFPGIALVSLAVAVCYLADRWFRGEPAASEDRDDARASLQAMGIGLTGVLVGVIPVIAANRYVDFERYSHYALPASLAAAAFLGGFLFALPSRRVVLPLGAALVACAVAAHYVYAVQVLQEESTISAFWHQVAWRAPRIAPQTTLYVSYPGVDYAEDVDAAQGPANFIYYLQPVGQIPVIYPLLALPQTDPSVTKVLVGKTETAGYRTHRGTFDFGRLLVLSQPTPSSCVRLIDSSSPLFSGQDPPDVRVIGALSRTSTVLNAPNAPALPAMLFGPEPPHDWCYYFERADLALQFGDWNQLASLGHQVAVQGLHPDDSVEWIPLLQAYAYFGDVPHFNETADRIAADPFARLQACLVMERMRQAGHSFLPALDARIAGQLCVGH